MERGTEATRAEHDESGEKRGGGYIVKSMGYFYMKSLNRVYCETKCLDVYSCPSPPVRQRRCSSPSLNYSSSPN